MRNARSGRENRTSSRGPIDQRIKTMTAHSQQRTIRRLTTVCMTTVCMTTVCMTTVCMTAACMAALLFVSATALGQPEASWRGKPVRHWIGQLADDDRQARRSGCADSFQGRRGRLLDLAVAVADRLDQGRLGTLGIRA